MDVQASAPTPTRREITIYLHSKGQSCAVYCEACKTDLMFKQHHVLRGSPKCDTCIAVDILMLHGQGCTVNIYKESDFGRGGQ